MFTGPENNYTTYERSVNKEGIVMDWADEVIDSLGLPLPNLKFRKDLTRALRKAQADGYERGFVEGGHILSDAAHGLFLDLLKDPDILAKIKKRASQLKNPAL